ncbi:hemerythrin domain-containing protein [Streptomyces sp. CA-135486]|uniref:hemerythrin domain-containing protein n=1 Tax=Streptomyces sp. CA-135486 TaxID=3240049 RepID=UPI003D928447
MAAAITSKTEREEAAKLPKGDVVGILLQQHGRIRDLFAEVKSAQREHKKQLFDELRAVLAMHETAEEMILRRAAKRTVGAEEAEARVAPEGVPHTQVSGGLVAAPAPPDADLTGCPPKAPHPSRPVNGRRP